MPNKFFDGFMQGQAQKAEQADAKFEKKLTLRDLALRTDNAEVNRQKLSNDNIRLKADLFGKAREAASKAPEGQRVNVFRSSLAPGANLFSNEEIQLISEVDETALSPAPEQPSLSDIRGIRQEVTRSNQEPVGVLDKFETLQNVLQLGTGSGDTAAIFTYMKMLDPTSVVRENEQASVSNAGGVPAHVRNLYNKLLEGDVLPPGVRQEVLQAAAQVARQANESIKTTNDTFSGIAQRQNMPVDQVITSKPRKIDLPVSNAQIEAELRRRGR